MSLGFPLIELVPSFLLGYSNFDTSRRRWISRAYLLLIV